MKEEIKNAKLEVIGYRENCNSREVLRDRNGQLLGVFHRDSKITRDRHGRVIGFHVNQLLRLL